MARKPILPDEFGNFTDKQLEKLKNRARNVCVWYLTKKRHTRKELEKKLVERLIPEDIIENTLNTLEEEGQINDAEYAALFVDSKRTYDKLGSQAIRYKLMNKGIPSDIIDEALSVLDEDNLRETALLLVRKKLPYIQKLEKQKQINRLVGMLAYKGYNAGVAFSVVKEAMDEYAETQLEEEEPPNFDD